MDSRQRVFLALSHRQPDRCPVDFWAVPEVVDRLTAAYGLPDEAALLDHFSIDLQFVSPRCTLAPFPRQPDGSWFDEMGVHRKLVQTDVCTYEEYASSPLGDITDAAQLASYSAWPDVECFDWDAFAGEIAPCHQKRVTKLYAGGIFEYAWALRGYEQFLMDTVQAPDIVHGIMSHLCDFWCRFVHRALTVAGEYIDIVYVYDDIASQDTLLLSPKMIREFIFPYHEKVNAIARQFGKRVMYHSCGAMTSQIPALLALGVEILNPLQPRAAGMDFQWLKQTYGDRLCFHGGICIQSTLPHGTQEEVRQAARTAIRQLGANGGYIMAPAHYIQNDTPTENIEALYDISLRS